MAPARGGNLVWHAIRLIYMNSLGRPRIGPNLLKIKWIKWNKTGFGTGDLISKIDSKSFKLSKVFQKYPNLLHIYKENIEGQMRRIFLMLVKYI